MSEEVALALGDLTHWQQRADEAEARAAILAAQLGGWEAQCAAQVAVLHDLLSYLSGMRYNVDTLKRRIEEVTETDAGATLLAAHQQQTKQLNDAIAQIAQLAEEAGRLDAGAAALRQALQRMADRDCIPAACYQIADQVLAATDAGATLLAELQAARHLGAAVQRYLGDTTLSPFVLADAVDAYERARKKESTDE